MTARLRYPDAFLSDERVRQIVRDQWLERYGRESFTATWDPEHRGLFGFLTDLALPADLQRGLDVIGRHGDDIVIRFGMQTWPPLRPGYSFTVKPHLDPELIIGWAP